MTITLIILSILIAAWGAWERYTRYSKVEELEEEIREDTVKYLEDKEVWRKEVAALLKEHARFCLENNPESVEMMKEELDHLRAKEVNAPFQQEFKRQLWVKDERMNNLIEMLSVLNISGITPIQKIVLFDLKFATHTGLPTDIKEIKDRTGVSVDSIMRSIRKLENKGILVVNRKQGKPNQYEVLK